MRAVLQGTFILAVAICALSSMVHASNWQPVHEFAWPGFMKTISQNGKLATYLNTEVDDAYTVDVLSIPGGDKLFSIPVVPQGNFLCYALDSIVNFSADGKRLAILWAPSCMMDASSSSLDVWDVETQTQILTFAGDELGAADFSADGSRVFLQGEEASWILDIQSGNILTTIPLAYPGYGSKAGHVIAFHNRDSRVSHIYNFDGVHLFDVNGFVKAFSLDDLHLGVFDDLYAPNNISVWNVDANTKSSTWQANQKWNYILAIYENYGLFTFADAYSKRSRMEMRDVETGEVLWSVEENIDAGIYEAAVSPDRSEIVIIKKLESNGPVARVLLQSINPANGQVLQTIAELVGQDYKNVFISNVVYQGNNRLVASLWGADEESAKIVTFER